MKLPVRNSYFWLAVITALIGAAMLYAWKNPPPPYRPNAQNNNSATRSYAVSGQPRLVVGYNPDCPPYEYSLDGRPAGFTIEILRGAAALENLALTFEPGSETELRQRFERGEIDILSGAPYRPGLSQQYVFSLPVIDQVYDIFVTEGSSIRQPQDLAGKQVIILPNAPSETYLSANIPLAVPVYAGDIESALNMLAAGQGEAALLPKDQAILLAKSGNPTKIRNLAFDPFSIPYGYAVQPGAGDLLYRLNRGIAQMRESGAYYTIYERWFGVSPQPMVWNLFRYAVVGLLFIALFLAISAAWLGVLQRQVRQRSAQLAASEEKYRQLAENASEGVVVIRGPQVLYANQRAADIIGYSIEEMLRLPIAVIMGEDRYESARQQHRSLMLTNGQVRSYTIKVRTKSGERRWLQVNGATVSWEGAPAYLDMFTDITAEYQAQLALRQSEDKFSKAFKTSPDSININRLSDGAYLEVNEGFTALTGYSEAEVIGIPSNQINIWANPEDRQRLLNEVMKQGFVRDMEFDFRIKNGSLRRGSLSARVIEVQGEPCLLTITRDVTERREAEQRIRQQVNRLAALRAVDLAMITSENLTYTLRILLDKVCDQLGLAHGGILLREEEKELRYLVARGFRANGTTGPSPLARQIFNLGRRLVLDSLRPEEAEGLPVGKMSSYLGLPFITRGQVVGVLELYHRGKLFLDDQDQEFLDAMMNAGAIAIENSRLLNNLEQANRDLIAAYDATIQGWARALELRDGETEGHSQRVTEMVLRLADALGVPESEQLHIRRGSLLHDIGKMAIPDSILLKKGPLSEDEWRIMRRHPSYAFELLSTIDFLRPALAIPYYHHERWDGSGYPGGISGEDIPLYARIFSVVDVWDALRTGRPYRPAMTDEEVYQYLVKNAGKHLDPRIVDTFLRLVYPDRAAPAPAKPRE